MNLKVITIIALLEASLVIQEICALRAQQSPCYEFLCGSEPSYLCGSDGKTYLNGCQYSQAQCKNSSLYVVFPGPCESYDMNPSTVTTPPVPVEVTVDSTTPDKPTTPDLECSNPYCSSNYSPVCGSDGITYSNRCQLKKVQCQMPGLCFKHEGRCKKTENCMFRICPVEENIICASDGKTYRNECELSIAKCYDQTLVPIAAGPCPNDVAATDPKCNTDCDDLYRPVCSTENVTYPNICFFEKARCKNKKIKIYKFEPC